MEGTQTPKFHSQYLSLSPATTTVSARLAVPIPNSLPPFARARLPMRHVSAARSGKVICSWEDTSPRDQCRLNNHRPSLLGLRR